MLAASMGCASYTSDYQPPADGRARVLWDDNHVEMGIYGTNASCLAAVSSEAAAPTYRHRGSGGASVMIWTPVPIVHVHHDVHVRHHGGVAPAPVGYRPASPTAVRAGGGSGSKGSSSGDTPKELVIVLAVAMIVASPVIAYGLALGRAEPEEEVAATIDRVNAYNDLSRWPGTPCSAAAAQGSVPGYPIQESP